LNRSMLWPAGLLCTSYGFLWRPSLASRKKASDDTQHMASNIS